MIIFNILPLIYYKYFAFITVNVNNLFGSTFTVVKNELPLAISFFTFQQISYLVDRSRNKTKEHKISEYFLFVTFFPQLIAGPIVHWSEMMPQFKKYFLKKINLSFLSLFVIGLSKKVLIADLLSSFVDSQYLMVESLSSFDSLILSTSYTFQLYFDFSGYCDMALASAGMLNIKLPINFNSPYKSQNIQEFWRRWHITLSRWLRDYIYIPLGGNKKSFSSKMCNVFITFLVGGIWHGAGYGFLVWGIMHAFMNIIFQLFSTLNIKLPRPLSLTLTLVGVNFAWIFFRAPDLDVALTVVQKILNFSQYKLNISFVHIYVINLILLFSVIKLQNSNELFDYYLKSKDSKRLILQILFVLLFLLSIIFIKSMSYSPFIYFNF